RSRLLDANEVEVDAVDRNLAGVDRLHAVIERGRKRKLQLGHWTVNPRSATGIGVSMPAAGMEIGARPQQRSSRSPAAVVPAERVSARAGTHPSPNLR